MTKRRTRPLAMPTILRTLVLVVTSIHLADFAAGQSPPPPTVTPESEVVAAPFQLNFLSAEFSGDEPGDEPLNWHLWSFGRRDDADFDQRPDRWVRYTGVGYPKFVRAELVAKDSEFEKQVQRIDAWIIQKWQNLQDYAGFYPWLTRLPPPPSVGDFAVDRYLRVDLDGGQFKLQSPPLKTQRKYQYQLSCDIMTRGLRYDSARVEFVFLDDSDQVVLAQSSQPISGTTAWRRVRLKMIRPPTRATTMGVRLIVDRSDDGFEDIHGTIGFDNIRIDQFPQLRVATEKARGVYQLGETIRLRASVLGVSDHRSLVDFHVRDHNGQPVADSRVPIEDLSDETVVTWTSPPLKPGFYRVVAMIDRPAVHSRSGGRPVTDRPATDRPVTDRPATDRPATDPPVVGRPTPKRSTSDASQTRLSSETTLVVIDPLLGGIPHGPFGWTLPKSVVDIPPRQLAQWLTDLGVAWVKYPCWLGPDQTQQAERVAAMLGRLQEFGIQTIGMLDQPPETEIANYGLRGKSDLVASQLFQNEETWKSKLESIMSRMTLKVRTWQIGGERDFSFAGRPRIRELIQKISKGLQGYSQPLRLAISWSWLESQLPGVETSWQATCRSADPPLQAAELDAYLETNEDSRRGNEAATWLLLDPIDKSAYKLDDRIHDMMMRMATVRRHRVEAAFVSDPYLPSLGFLKPDGQPDEMLLPWRTTSRLIGHLRNTGSTKLRGGSECLIFTGQQITVLVVWSPQPTEERMYLGENIQQVDVWGQITPVPVVPDPVQPHQHVQVGPLPTFLTGVDPELLAFRMAVDTQPTQFDSLLGQKQDFSVIMTNPIRESLAGSIRIVPPRAWSIAEPTRTWEMLSAGSATETFDVVLGNTAKIGEYEIPIQFELDTVPPKRITIHRNVSVGPRGLTVKVTTRLLPSGRLRVRIDMTNQSTKVQSYHADLFAPGRQFQNTFITIRPGQMVRREIFWEQGQQLIGREMVLRARQQDGDRVMNYTIEVNR